MKHADQLLEAVFILLHDNILQISSKVSLKIEILLLFFYKISYFGRPYIDARKTKSTSMRNARSGLEIFGDSRFRKQSFKFHASK